MRPTPDEPLKGRIFRAKRLFFQPFASYLLLRDLCGFGAIFHFRLAQNWYKNGVYQLAGITMARIIVRKRANGSFGYTAQIRLHHGKSLVHQEAKTFSRRAAAEKWARAREVELEDPTALLRAQDGDVTLASLIRWYIDSFQSLSKWQRTKQCQLEFLEKHPIGKSDALKLTPSALVNHARSRRANGAGPATVGNDLTWIAVVLRAAKSVKGVLAKPEIVEEARTPVGNFA